MVANVLFAFGDVFQRKVIPLITLVWVTMFALRSARIVLSNYTKTRKMKWRNVSIWQAMKGIMIAKRKNLHVPRYVLYLTNHPIAANLVA